LYFSPDDFGEEYAGWYLYFSTYIPLPDRVDSDDRRGYVLKSKTKNLQGDWVNPLTGEVGVPQKIASETHDWVNNNHWFTGPNVFRYNGEIYGLFVVQNDRQTAKFRQTCYLSKMKNPWTFTGTVLELINPEYDWEKVGHAYDAANNLWYPAVIESTSAIVSDDNDLYVIYSASGYWTTGYCLGQMTFLGGDLFDINNWKKSPTPILSKSNEANGVGSHHISTLPDGTGQYILYHGYLGSDTTSGRYLFIEPITVGENGLEVGFNKRPSPLSTEFEMKINPTPLAKKISGFDNYEYTPPVEDNVVDETPLIDNPAGGLKDSDLIILMVASLAGIFVISGAAVIVILKTKKTKKENENET
jgi:GH43 family beta-xylosidase